MRNVSGGKLSGSGACGKDIDNASDEDTDDDTNAALLRVREFSFIISPVSLSILIVLSFADEGFVCTIITQTQLIVNSMITKAEGIFEYRNILEF